MAAQRLWPIRYLALACAAILATLGTLGMLLPLGDDYAPGSPFHVAITEWATLCLLVWLALAATKVITRD